MSGEGGNGATQTSAYSTTNLFMNVLLDPSIDNRGGADYRIGRDTLIGFATGGGGLSACSVIEQGLADLLIGADARDIARLWDQMYRSSLPYGRKGLALMAISAVDLALWDLLGQLRGGPGQREPLLVGEQRAHRGVQPGPLPRQQVRIDGFAEQGVPEDVTLRAVGDQQLIGA